MEGTYNVMLGSQKMGTVSVRKQGLYWHFDCCCNLSGEVMHDLVIRIGEMRIKLGLLTPENGRYSLRTKQPCKQFREGSPVFSLQPRHAKINDTFLPIHPSEPFRYLNALEKAYLVRHEEQIGMIIQE